MRVTDIITGYRSLSTNFAYLGHFVYLLIYYLPSLPDRKDESILQHQILSGTVLFTNYSECWQDILPTNTRKSTVVTPLHTEFYLFDTTPPTISLLNGLKRNMDVIPFYFYLILF